MGGDKTAGEGGETRGLTAALGRETPLQIAGAINPYFALLAARAGCRALYLSGGGVAANLGLPDLGVIHLGDVERATAQIAAVVDLPLLVDADTGFGAAPAIARAVRTLARAGAAAIHIEDQAGAKRCGHRPNKNLASREEMQDRIKAAVDARPNDGFEIMARTDALAVESPTQAVERAAAYVEAGADFIFVEAATEIDQYRAFRAVGRPLLANITEFGSTPLFTRDELAAAGIDLILYPLTAFRMMAKAAQDAYETLRRDGGQKSLLARMQTREELYEVLGYHEVERALDRLYGRDESQQRKTR